MAEKVIMPKQGLQMTEGTIIKWLYSEGDKVEEGKPLFEMETDKLTIEIEAPATGILLKIVEGEGQTVPITELIGVIGEPGENIDTILAETKASEAEEEIVAQKDVTDSIAKPEAKQSQNVSKEIFITPRAKMRAQEADIDFSNINGTGPESLIIERDIIAVIEELSRSPKATPLAKKMAELTGIDISEVKGSGVRGKIMKQDVAGLSQTEETGAQELETIIPFKGMRKVISENMMKSLQTTAQANHRMKVDMSEIIRFREKLKSDNIKVSFSDILVKVVSKALLDFPIVNSSLKDESIILKHYVNMGLAVALEDGLIVPVIKDAHKKTLQQISQSAKELVDKARTGKLSPNDYKGGTFTITNLGMYDIDEFTAIINPPESAILAVGKIDKVPVVIEDKVEIRPIMVLSLTYDHRIIDGSPAAQFLQRIKQLLQNPYLLI